MKLYGFGMANSEIYMYGKQESDNPCGELLMPMWKLLK